MYCIIYIYITYIFFIIVSFSICIDLAIVYSLKILKGYLWDYDKLYCFDHFSISLTFIVCKFDCNNIKGIIVYIK